MQTTLRLLAVIFAGLVTGLTAQTTPLGIEQTVEAQFPSTLALTTITRGEAHIIINVDAEGRLVDWLVAGYTDKAFADEAVTVLKRWRYTPATERGKPVGVRMDLRFDFEARGRIVSLMAIQTVDVLIMQSGGQRHLVTHVCQPQDLDQPIAPVNPTSPRYPGQASASAASRSVLVDFYVDEKGQPRMPVVVNASHTVLAQAAVGALNQWRFTTPTRAGRPVSVRVQQEFVFPASS